MLEHHWRAMRSEIKAALKRQEEKHKRRKEAQDEEKVESAAMDAALHTEVCAVFENFFPESFYRQMDSPSSERGDYFTHVDTPHFTVRARFPITDLKTSFPNVTVELWHTKTFTFDQFQTLDEALWFADKYGASPMTNEEIKTFYSPLGV